MGKKTLTELSWFNKYNLVFRLRRMTDYYIWSKVLYILMPFVLVALLIWCLLADGVLIDNADVNFSFLRDVSNSIGIPILMIVAFFVSGAYLEYTCNVFNDFSQVEKGTFTKRVQIVQIIANVGWLAGIPFVIQAFSNGEGFWMCHISWFPTFLIYLVNLGLTWYCSLLIAFTEVYICCQYMKLFFSNANSDLEKIFDMFPQKVQESAFVLAVNVVLGIYYVMGTLLFLLNDYSSHVHYDLDNVFFKFPFINITVVLISLTILILAAYPLYKIYFIDRKNKIKKKEQIKSKMIKAIQQEKVDELEIIQKENAILKEILCPLVESKMKVLALFFSALFPVVGLILGILELILR